MLQQKLSQKQIQKLSPQQIQLMKLFQVPTAHLEQRIKEELESNPALEDQNDSGGNHDTAQQENNAASSEDEDSANNLELDSYIETYAEDDPIMYQHHRRQEDKDVRMAATLSFKESFHDHLRSQFDLQKIDDPRLSLIGLQIIGSIDDDGYLRREVESIIDDLLFAHHLEVSEDEVLKALKIVQSLDPPGIGARDLRENLLLQIQSRITSGEVDDSEGIGEEEAHSQRIARRILDKYFTLFSKKNYHKLIDQLHISEEELRSALSIIQQLNPKPMNGADLFISQTDNHYIVPDYELELNDGVFDLRLHGINMPELNVNRQYVNMLQQYRDRTQKRKASSEEKETIHFIKQKLDSAKWFIDAIRQRQDTLYRTMYAILQLQRDYFLTGNPLKLKPMVLKDVSELTKLDISTISRIVNNKYIQTEFGTKFLKDLFSEALTMPDGKEVSSLEIKNALADIIDAEDKRTPFSDENLRLILKDKGYEIARRTVTKYREYLNKPVARLRKEL